jgi:hypothetical protein
MDKKLKWFASLGVTILTDQRRAEAGVPLCTPLRARVPAAVLGVQIRAVRHGGLSSKSLPQVYGFRAGFRRAAVHATAADASCTSPPSNIARRRPCGPPSAMAKTAPSTATPIVAPAIRATLIRAAAVPERAAATAPTAAPISGPVARPFPEIRQLAPNWRGSRASALSLQRRN